MRESGLAEELGISRTPLREALTYLEREGFVERIPNRGFFVTPLRTSEATELYQVLAYLECEALRNAGLPSASALKKLVALNQNLPSTEADGEKTLAWNLAWHETLLEHCPNGFLLELIRSVRQRVLRYEHAYFAPGLKRMDRSMQLHNEVLSRLEKKNLAGAIEALERHWLGDLDDLLATVPDHDDEEIIDG